MLSAVALMGGALPSDIFLVFTVVGVFLFVAAPSLRALVLDLVDAHDPTRSLRFVLLHMLLVSVLHSRMAVSLDIRRPLRRNLVRLIWTVLGGSLQQVK